MYDITFAFVDGFVQDLDFIVCMSFSIARECLKFLQVFKKLRYILCKLNVALPQGVIFEVDYSV